MARLAGSQAPRISLFPSLKEGFANGGDHTHCFNVIAEDLNSSQYAYTAGTLEAHLIILGMQHQAGVWLLGTHIPCAQLSELSYCWSHLTAMGYTCSKQQAAEIDLPTRPCSEPNNNQQLQQESGTPLTKCMLGRWGGQLWAHFCLRCLRKCCMVAKLPPLRGGTPESASQAKLAFSPTPLNFGLSAEGGSAPGVSSSIAHYAFDQLLDLQF